MSTLKHASVFYQHYWRCFSCQTKRRCSEGAALQRQYAINSIAISISKIKGRDDRRLAIGRLKPDMHEPVKEKLQEIWDGR